MNLEKFLQSLSESEIIELESILHRRKEIANSKRLKVTEFVELYKYSMSIKLRKLLLFEAKETEYIDMLLSAKLSRYKSIGAKTLTELEQYMKQSFIDTSNFNSVHRYYLNDLVMNPAPPLVISE